MIGKLIKSDKWLIKFTLFEKNSKFSEELYYQLHPDYSDLKLDKNEVEFEIVKYCFKHKRDFNPDCDVDCFYQTESVAKIKSLRI